MFVGYDELRSFTASFYSEALKIIQKINSILLST